MALPKTWYEPEEDRPQTWAEPSAAFLGRQQVTAEEIARTRESFREVCIRQHGSVVRAWKVMDLNGDLRLTYFEFMRGCKQMDLMNARRIWCALGRTGFIMLQDIDAKLGEQLGSLAGLLWCTFGSVEQAWRTCFNKTSKLRIGHDEFKQACHEVKFKGDSWLCFTELCSEKASNGMSRKEFGFLHSWIQPGKPDRGFIDNPPSRWDLPSQPWAPPPNAVKKGSRRKRFKDCLLRSYGNIVRAWREGLDRDHNDRMDYSEFSIAVKDVGYPGNAKELWQELDLNKNGYVSLWELDEPTALLLREFVDTARSNFGSWAAFWHCALDVRGDDRVLYPEFRDGCIMLGWRESDRLFELLDTDLARYLSWSSSSWLAGAELEEGGCQAPSRSRAIAEDGEPTVFTKATKAQSRARHQKLREHRHRVKCFEGRARGEIPGSHPAAGTTIYSPGVSLNSHIAGSKTPPILEMPTKTVFQSTSLELEDDLPDWLLMAEGRMRMPEPMPKADLSFPLKPQQPGKGGWPCSKLYLTDELWGGSKDLGRLLRPLTRKACSQQNLERWKKLATDEGPKGDSKTM